MKYKANDPLVVRADVLSSVLLIQQCTVTNLLLDLVRAQLRPSMLLEEGPPPLIASNSSNLRTT